MKTHRGKTDKEVLTKNEALMNRRRVDEKKGQTGREGIIFGIILDVEIREFSMKSRTYLISHLIRSASLFRDK